MERNGKEYRTQQLFLGLLGKMLVLVGMMAENYGPKIVLSVTMTLASLSSIALPFAAPCGYLFISALRMLQGATAVGFWVKYETV